MDVGGIVASCTSLNEVDLCQCVLDPGVVDGRRWRSGWRRCGWPSKLGTCPVVGSRWLLGVTDLSTRLEALFAGPGRERSVPGNLVLAGVAHRAAGPRVPWEVVRSRLLWCVIGGNPRKYPIKNVD